MPDLVRGFRLRDLGFGTRLFLVCLLAIGVTSTLTTMLLVRSQKSALAETQLRMGHALAASLAGAAVEPLLDGDYSALDTLVERVISSDSWVVHCSVARADGEAVADFATSTESSPVIVMRSIELEGRELGMVTVAFSREKVASLIEDRLWSLRILSWAQAGLTSLFLALVLLRLVGRPVAQLHSDVTRMQQEDFTEPILWEGRGEFDRVAQALEGMRLDVVQSRAALECRNAELQSALMAAEESDRAKATFIATISHEVRTPLMGVLGASSVMRHMGGLDADQEGLLETIRTSSECLLAQVNDVLDYSKAAASMLELDSEDVYIEELLAEIVSVLAGQTRERGLQLIALMESGAPLVVVGDRQRLRQVLLNLVGNAVKFTSEGSVTMLGTLSGNALRLEVRDTGTGLPDDVEPAELFEPFQQGKGAAPGAEPGTGLGLSISRELVQRMGGTIGAANHGSGAMFWIEVPAAEGGGLVDRPAEFGDGPMEVRLEGPESALTRGIQAQLEAWSIPINDQAEITIASTTFQGVLSPDRLRTALLPAPVERDDWNPAEKEQGLSVLAADDNPTNRKILELMLTNLGHHAVLVEDGQVAAERFRHQAFDLVLLDYHMPNLDGPQAARAIRAIERETGQEHTQILAVSAAVGLEERSACHEAGMDGFLAKPFRLHDLSKALRVSVRSAA